LNKANIPPDEAFVVLFKSAVVALVSMTAVILDVIGFEVATYAVVAEWDADFESGVVTRLEVVIFVAEVCAVSVSVVGMKFVGTIAVELVVLGLLVNLRRRVVVDGVLVVVVVVVVDRRRLLVVLVGLVVLDVVVVVVNVVVLVSVELVVVELVNKTRVTVLH
jgi:hypothetical protein